MTYRIELHRHRALVAHSTSTNPHHARRKFRALLRRAGKDGMVVVIHHGVEISPRTLQDHEHAERTSP